MVVCCTAQGRKKAYDFEKIFSPDSTQDEVALMLSPPILIIFSSGISRY